MGLLQSTPWWWCDNPRGRRLAASAVWGVQESDAILLALQENCGSDSVWRVALPPSPSTERWSVQSLSGRRWLLALPALVVPPMVTDSPTFRA